ncbi:LysR family transcriptional regulator [Streptomyces sp. NPDC051940]|uniref:LysR family transcriptional regulator n=1 Tax=Streptomyces sp. NPDC051940 TaxID=3155675 RepID=UPI00341D4972
MLDLTRLRALHAVHVHGSIAGAAAALGYSPSAVSQSVGKLERETRTTLLERQGRGVVLTDAGQHLAGTAKQLLALVERAETDLEAQRGRPGGRLTVAAFATAARGLLPGALAALTREHPGLDTRLMEADPHLSPDMVARGVVDLAVCHDWDIAPLPAPDGLELAVIGDDTCEICVPADHPFASRTAPLRRADLAGQRWICQPAGSVCHDWLVRTLRVSGHEPELAYEAAEYATQLALVAEGLGIALVPHLGRGPLPAGVVAVPLDPVPVRRVYAVWRARAARRPAIKEAVRALRTRWAEIA